MPQQHKVKINSNFLAQLPAQEPKGTSVEHRYDVIDLPDVQTLGQSYLAQRYGSNAVHVLPFNNEDRNSTTINLQAPTPPPEPTVVPVKSGYDGKTELLAQMPSAEPKNTSLVQQDGVNANCSAQPLSLIHI